MQNLNVANNTLHYQMKLAFFLTAADNILVQKTQNSRFLESLPFSKILLMMKAEQEVTEIPHKITTLTPNLLHNKPMQSYSYQLISDT